MKVFYTIHRFWICLGLLTLSLAGNMYAQNLGSLQVTPIENTQQAKPVFIDYPEAAAVIVLSSIPNLQVRSTLPILTNKSKTEEGRYVWLVQAARQELTISSFGYQSVKYVIQPTQAREVLYFRVEPLETKPVEGRGNLVLTSEPSGAAIYLDGFPDFVQKTPYTFVNYAAQPYQIRLELENYQTLDLVLSIKEGKTIRKNVVLTPTYGTLTIQTVRLLDEFRGNRNLRADQLTLEISGIKQPLILGKPITLPVGTYSIKLSGKDIVPYENDFTVLPGENTVVNAETVPDFNKNYTLTGEQGIVLLKTDLKENVVFIFPDQIFKGYDYSRNFKPGTYSAMVKTPYNEKKITFNVRNNEVTDLFIPFKPDFERVAIANMIPGLGQIMLGKKRGYFYSLTALSAATVGVYGYSSFKSAQSDKKRHYFRYQTATTEDEALFYRDKTISAQKDMDTWFNIARYSLYTGLGVAGLSMLDLVVIPPKQGWRSKKDVDVNYTTVWGASTLSPTTVKLLSVIPGLSQISVGDERGWVYFLSTVGSLGLAAYQLPKITNVQEELALAKQEYKQSQHEVDVLNSRNKVQSLLKREHRLISTQTISLLTGVSIYAVSIADALLLKPDYGWRKNKTGKRVALNLSVSPNLATAQPVISLTYRW